MKRNRSSASLRAWAKGSSQKLITQQIEQLRFAYPDAHCELFAETPFQLLVATVLSAQCTDARVNLVTPTLFSIFPNAESMAKADLQTVEMLIRSTGFFRSKAKNILALSKIIVISHGGKIPQSLAKLVELPGVGRKTANVVLGNSFKIASGIVVDTHVARLGLRLGWTQETKPEKIEASLQKKIPKADWIQVSHWLIRHGRSLCKARSPKCTECFIRGCPSRKAPVG